MLRPLAYLNVCAHLWPSAVANQSCVIDHDPRGADDGAARAARFRSTLQLYHNFYGAPPACAWTADAADKAAEASNPATVIHVKSLTGKSICVHVDLARDRVQDVKEYICGMEGTPVDQQRLICAGKQLEDGCTLAEYGIPAGSVLHLVVRQTGC